MLKTLSCHDFYGSSKQSRTENLFRSKLKFTIYVVFTIISNTLATLFLHPYDVVLTLWMLYGCRNDVVCLLGLCHGYPLSRYNRLKKNYALLIAAYKYEMLFDCLLKVLKNVTIIKNISLYGIDCCENLLKICNAEYP